MNMPLRSYYANANHLSEFIEESLDRARISLFHATMYAMANRLPEVDGMFLALNDLSKLTRRIIELGLLPPDVSGDEDVATDWLEDHIDLLLEGQDPHPLLREWWELNAERHRIAYHLPRLN